MRILSVVVSMDPSQGGVCQSIRNTTPELLKQGVESEVLCFDTPDASYLGNDSFIIHAIGPAKGPYAHCKNLQSWMAANISRFDVIIIHGLWLYHSYGTYKAWKKYKQTHDNAPRLYVMPHGMLDPYFQRAKDRRLKAIRNWFFWKFVEQKVINNATGLLFTCEEELLLARETFTPYKPKAELNVGLGIIAPPKYEEKPMNDAFYNACPDVKDSPFLLFLSRIHEKKGVDLLVKAYIRLKQEVDNLPKLVIAGPGLDSVYGKEILSLSQNDSDILFPGMISGNTKWGAFYNCDAFVLSSHQENFGIAIVEAMACSKAVLISNKINIWREIKDNNSGFVGDDTEESTYNTLKEWVTLSSAEKTNIGTNASHTFADYFTVEAATRKMIKALNS